MDKLGLEELLAAELGDGAQLSPRVDTELLDTTTHPDSFMGQTPLLRCVAVMVTSNLKEMRLRKAGQAGSEAYGKRFRVLHGNDMRSRPKFIKMTAKRGVRAMRCCIDRVHGDPKRFLYL